MNMTSAFISYSVKDEVIAEQLYGVMTRMGITTFMAGISIEPGKKWAQTIFNNLKSANWIFFIASKNACKSQAVQQELGASIIQEKTIIPILIDITPKELPGWINRYQAIDPKQTPELLHKTIETIAEKIKIDNFWAGVILGAILVGLFCFLKD